ncbi:hypothetical protein WJX73_009658 [Symbiochloris irregularis]|uniref:Aminopeptidase P N-terminal domain-containing protein n=1 Tax=Symbiochloris irregularis TaxID=706552 RepID=A0AAW1Q171_9CHLO
MALLRRYAARLRSQIAGRGFAGQPLPETHPELLNEGELTPGLAATEYAHRRKQLAHALPPGCLALVPAAPTVHMSPGGPIPYPYRQDAEFLYLTGLTQQGVAVIESTSSSAQGKFTLFLPTPTDAEAVWNGRRVTCDTAIARFGADAAYPISQLPQQLHPLVARAPLVFFDANRHVHNPLLLDGISTASPAATELHMLAAQGRIKSLRALTHNFRWIKSPAEVELMRQSASVAAGAIGHCIRSTWPGIQERQLEALFEFKSKWSGAQRNAYPPVVASGLDATTIHYARNDKVVRDGQLMLMDAGCEMNGYVSDITRTWPVSGSFSPPQRDIYQLVLHVHGQCIAECRPGQTLKAIHQKAVRLLSEGVKDLGLFPSLSVDAIERSAYRQCFSHAIGHWLGMDTHDVASVPHDRHLQPGVVLTIEPGLYFSKDPKYGHYGGIGVRIEDDVAVTSGEPCVLSDAVPVGLEQIEQLVGSSMHTYR